MSLDEAARLVPDGAMVGIGGCTMSRTPMAMVWALIRAGQTGPDILRAQHQFRPMATSFASGTRPHIITSWFSQGIVWGVSRVMRH